MVLLGSSASPYLRASPYTAQRLLSSTAIAAGAYATSLGKYYGTSGTGSVNQGLRATLWNGVDSYVDLGPGDVNDALGSTFAGSYMAHAALWTSPTNRIDLNPVGFSTSWIGGLAPGVGVGTGTGFVSGKSLRHALLWQGTTGSFTDLQPAAGYSMSDGRAASATQQVGWAETIGPGGTVGKQHAMLWSGTAGSYVDLHPAHGFASSWALGVSRGRQVGIGFVGDPIVSTSRALMWSGSAASVVDLSPPGYLASEATRVIGDWAIGDGVDANYQHHAILWDLSTSPTTIIDLEPAAVAAGVGGATPWNLSSSGAIAGVKVTVTNPGPPREKTFTPVAWTPEIRLPGDANLDGEVSFGDFQIWEQNFGSKDSWWKTGDFNDDRVTDTADFALLMRHYGQSVNGTPAASVPEPGAVLWVAAIALLARRGKRRSC
ncbi:MAG: hypothetical protein JWN40_4282 [Phycisphaerales bacterium]|nr:hypothetical protein [Phycisphaerales bacterium]